MSYRTTGLVCFVVLLIGSAVFAADKQSIRVERIGDVQAQDLFVAPSLITADACFVTDNGELKWRIDDWVIGFELFKSLMDPAASCDSPYPFTITAINMPMMFDAATPLTISVDIEAVDNTSVPGCPTPGPLLAVSSEWQTTVPGAGMYNIWIPLDAPLVVNEPFFAGFYIGSAIDPAVGAAVLCDSLPVPCTTFNIWDETIGWIDLVNNTLYNFPGRLLMEVAGIPGGSGGNVTSPEVEILTPSHGDILYGEQELWAWDSAVTGAAEYVMFEYSDGGPYVEIGRDFDGTGSLRDGISPNVTGNGFNVNWNFSGLTEGYYNLRATLVDTTGARKYHNANVFLEPTPPIATIGSPANGTIYCAPVDIEMSTNDENISFVEVQHREAQLFYSVGVVPMSQFEAGDANGNPSDGNRVSAGEFGDYYSAPAAAAMAAGVWSDRGYPGLVKQGAVTMTTAEVAEGFAVSFKTRESKGSYDEAVMAGLKSYSGSHGGGFEYEQKRNPNYSQVRIWIEDEERLVMLGLGGTPGFWVTMDSFAGWLRADSTYVVSVANPITGRLESVSWRDGAGYSEILVGGSWHRVDIMISMLAADWNITRTMVGADFSGLDGWSLNWNPIGQIDGTHHFLRSVGHDYDNHLGSSTVLVEHNCASVYVPGDYDNDRSTTISDLFRLIDFIAKKGSAPLGGAERADCNCDNVVNVADIIYYMNFLYGTASPPCR